MKKLTLAPGQSPAELLASVTKTAKRNKYGAKKTNGYDSKAEAKYAMKLGMLKQAGVIVDWLEQVPIKLGDGITYRVDFMIIKSDWTVKFVEVKGFQTKEYRIKRKLLDQVRPAIAARTEVVK